MEASTCHPGAMGAAGVAVQEEKEGGLKPWRVQVRVKSFGVVWR